MNQHTWILLSTLTTGLIAPIQLVEIAAQRMCGWKPEGMAFRRLLCPDAEIPQEFTRVYGYTQETLERDAESANQVYADFANFVAGAPIVSYNLEFDWDKVLLPQWQRLGIEPIGYAGFCALKLAQRLLDPLPTGNLQLQTLRQFYHLPEPHSQSALGNVETLASLMTMIFQPMAEHRGLATWEDITLFLQEEWYPARIAFGKFKGRHFQDAASDEALYAWLLWLTESSNIQTANMGRWYLKKLNDIAQSHPDPVSSLSTPSQTTTVQGANASIVVFVDPELEQLRQFISIARAELADLEACFTKERLAVELVQASIFKIVRPFYQKRERLKLLIDYRNKFLQTLLLSGEDEAAQIAAQFSKAKTESDTNFQSAAESADGRKKLSLEEDKELNILWKKLVRLFHPDRFANQPEKLDTYNKLTSFINKARDDGDISLLREIANDPEGYILRAGWVELDFSEGVDARQLQRLLESLQLETLKTIEALNNLHKSPEFELFTLSQEQPHFIEEIAQAQCDSVIKEIVQMEKTATDLQNEINILTGESAPDIHIDHEI